MYERFTDRARKVMQLANQEAQRFNHEYIGTEHILLGLVKEGSGVAANVLKNLDIDLRKIRLEVEKIVQSGPDMVNMGKLPQTPRAKKVIEHSIDEARGLAHNYVGTEHILLGLLREVEGVASQVLTNLGLKLEKVREETLNLLGQNINKENKENTIKELDAKIELLNFDKEKAVAACDFDRAANLRDQVDQLKKDRKSLEYGLVMSSGKVGMSKLKELVSSAYVFPNAVEVVIIKKSIWDEIIKLTKGTE
jgi:ATP-dependent Clp protease ATP-binding subunit ClpA